MANKDPSFKCPKCGNEKTFRVFSTGIMESLVEMKGSVMSTVSEEFKDGGCIDKIVCAECGEEV